jgi:hypothetical protein
MYYVGCHWGTIDDGYVCSSNRMYNTHKRRPETFKRRIIKRGIEKQNLLEEEYKWLKLIPTDQLGRKYYNLHNHHFGHWTNNPNTQSIKEKISQAKSGVKTKMTEEQLADRGRKISEAKAEKRKEREELGLPLRQKPTKPIKSRGPQSEESNKKRSETMKQAWIDGKAKGITGMSIEWSEERRQNHKASLQGAHDNRDNSAYSEAVKIAWADGKYNGRKSNNMKDYIWVRRLSDNTRTRIHKDTYDEKLYMRTKI